MAGFDRSRINLGRRTQQLSDERESSGVRRKSYMNYGGCRLKFFKFADVGKYQDINILPWKISNERNPIVVRCKDMPTYLKDGSRNPDKYMVGDYDYVLDVWVHPRIGVNEEDCLCLKRTYGEYCPICEEADRLSANSETKESAKALYAKHKCVYLVDELNDKFESVSDEPKIFEVTHGLFSKELQGRAASCMRGQGVVDFASVSLDEKGREIGKVVSFTVGEDTMGGGRKYKKAINFDFNERKQEVSDEMLEKCPSLDSFLVVKTPDEMKAMLYGEVDSEDSTPDESYEEQPRNERRSERSRQDEPANDYRRSENTTDARSVRFVDNEPAEDEPRETRRSRPTDENDYSPRSRRNVEEESYEEQPRNERRFERSRQDEPVDTGRSTRASDDDYQNARMSARRGTAADEPTMPFDDEPSDEHAEETPRERPREREAPKRETGKCPFGHVYGVDCDRGNNCGRCPDDIYAKCSAANQSR